MTHMRSTPRLLEASPTEGYAVRLRFDDGIGAEVDLGHLRDYGGVFEPLRELEYFRRLRLDAGLGTITWPNEADVAPETLYAHARRQAGAAA
jgi:hypothetical protein